MLFRSLGTGIAEGSDSVHNGAEDNASGTAALLGVARGLAAADGGLQRSILLLATAATESGRLGSEEFLRDTPFHLILVEFDGADTLLLARLIGVDRPEDIRIGMRVKAKFRRNSQLKPTDVYFVPA